MLEFSFFKGPIKNTKPFVPVSLSVAIDKIKGEGYRETIERLRRADDPNTVGVLKNSLDYFTFSGTFRKRANDALMKHSGLICIDFDGMSVEEIDRVRPMLKEIDFVAAYFVSPSGAGLKVVCRISPKKHEASFEGLKAFFSDNLEINPDKGVRDVARACFVSWDPDAYCNLKAKVYNPPAPVDPEPLPERKDEAPTEARRQTASQRLDALSQLDRVRYCVEQIERDRIDITDNDYDDRLLVGFSLSTLGEDARELYHRAVQFNDAYERKDADYKFDDALKNSKFKTPAKFFKLCTLHDILTKKPRTIEQAKVHAEVKEIIGNEEDANAYEAYGIWLNKQSGTYYSLDLKNVRREITNFKMKIIYHVATSDDEAYRIIQIKNVFGLDKVIRVNTDDFVSSGTFKKIIARHGNFIFKGADFDLVRLQDMLQRDEKPTKLVNTLGWNKRGGFYAFANGIYDTKLKTFLPIDEFGIVEHEYDGRPQNYFIPAMSRMFAEKEDLYTNDKKFKLVQGTVSFSEWASLFEKVFGNNGRIGMMFYVAALFSDIIFKANGQRFPLCFAYGKRGSGKGTMIQSIMRLFGEGQDPIMLGGASTVVGFMRKLAQYSNALVWMDEYKNNLHPKIIESQKNIFDRIGYERGKKDNTFQTESTPILSAVFLSGQEMPTVEPALFTRTILMTFSETKRTEAARKLIRNLVEMENKGISHLTLHLMQYRELFTARYKTTYERVLHELSVEINSNDVDERMLGNYSVLIATCELVAEIERLPFTLDNFRSQCKQMAMEQWHVLRGSDDTSKFWQIVEQLAGSGLISEDRHYQLKNGNVDIRVQDIYQLYAEAMQKRKDPNILDKSTLDSYLMSDAKTFVKRHRTYFGGHYRWALQFKYMELGIDLIKSDTVEGLKAKYREMGLPDDEVNADVSANGVDPVFAMATANDGPSLFDNGPVAMSEEQVKKEAGF